MSSTKTLPLFGLFLLSIILILTSCSNEKKAAEIHERILTIDSHTDTPMRLLRSDFDISVRHEPGRKGGLVDLPRMKEGGLDAIFFAVFIGQGQRDAESNEKAKNRALEIHHKIHESVEKNANLAGIALTPEDAYRLQSEGKRAIYIGMENGYPVGKDLSLIKEYYDLGTRYITLCHTKNNDICDSSTDDDGPEHGGLSEFGTAVVREMNRLGIMVDISHISDDAVMDVLEISTAPVIASHSCARAVCDNPRNLNDDLLKLIAENNGVVQVCLLSDYVKKIQQDSVREKAVKELRSEYKNYSKMSEEEKEKIWQKWEMLNEKYPKKMATVSDFVDHIDHIVKVAGIDYVGIGSDFDGGGGLADCRDVSQMGNITLELVNRGYSEEEIEKIWAGNFMRVFKEVEKRAQKPTLDSAI
jgi:membrane dipeptidase